MRLKRRGGERFVWLLIAASAAVFFVTATTSGVGLPSDSFFYLGGAEGILAGEGFARPAADGSWKTITHFPPLYSALIALLSIIFSITTAARVLNLVIFVGNTLLAGFLIRQVTEEVATGWLASLAWMTAPTLLTQHISVLSEGLFLSFMLLILLLLHFYLKRRRIWILIAVGLMCSLAYLVRYAGASLFMPCVFLLLIESSQRPTRRMVKALLIMVVALTAPALWAWRNIRLIGSASNRVLSWHPITRMNLLEVADTVRGWIIPFNLPTIFEVGLLVLYLLLVATVIFFALRKRLHNRSDVVDPCIGFVVILSFGIASYLALLTVSISLFDASIPLDDRILSPVFALSLLLLFAFFVWTRNLYQRFSGWSTAVVLIFTTVTMIRGFQLALYSSANPSGFAAPAWQDAPATDTVRELDEDVLLYSNEIDGIYLLTGRMAYLIPVEWDPVTQAERQDFPLQIATMRTRLEENDGCLVLFSSLERQGVFPPEEVLTEGLHPVREGRAASVYCAGRP